MLQFIGLLILGFVGMEIFSYLVHRWLFHGLLWDVHVTHHTPRKGWFELNDLFSLIFAAVSIFFIVSGSEILSPIGWGVAVYGLVYFITHDLFTHRRFLPFGSKNKILLTIRAAHQRHHQSVEKIGLEPFGLFFFDYLKFWRKASPHKQQETKNEFPIKDSP
jgi:beta-carotene 3-hydroxylase